VPGSTGGTPVQNVGAYGALVSQFLRHVVAYDRCLGEVVTIPGDACGFGSHRQSIFKHSSRHVILAVELVLEPTGTSRPLAYAGLAQRLGRNLGDVAPTEEVRRTVLDMRRERAMLLDATDHDTWSVGSFFINPVLESVPEKARDCPTFPDKAGVKLPAAWLIDHAGFPPGYGAQWGRGRVRLSTKHALAVTNRGGATTGEVMAFAAHVREGVEQAFDVRLGPECDLLNCSFDDPSPEWLATASAG
jgi:UDP-N-acetylmuramate dehydrogenase